MRWYQEAGPLGDACHKSEVHMNGISALIKDTLQVGTQQEVCSLQPQRGHSPEPDLVGMLIWNFQPPELRNTFLLFISHSVYGVLL